MEQPHTDITVGQPVGAADPEAVSRIVLLRELRFVGHRYRCGGMHAVRLLVA